MSAPGSSTHPHSAAAWALLAWIHHQLRPCLCAPPQLPHIIVCVRTRLPASPRNTPIFLAGQKGLLRAWWQHPHSLLGLSRHHLASARLLHASDQLAHIIHHLSHSIPGSTQGRTNRAHLRAPGRKKDSPLRPFHQQAAPDSAPVAHPP